PSDRVARRSARPARRRPGRPRGVASHRAGRRADRALGNNRRAAGSLVLGSRDRRNTRNNNVMRLLLVGSERDRDRLRAQLDGSIEIAGEFATLGAARAADLRADGILVAPDHRGREDDLAVEPLTAREIQVLELLAEGLPNKAIAARLGIS